MLRLRNTTQQCARMHRNTIKPTALHYGRQESRSSRTIGRMSGQRPSCHSRTLPYLITISSNSHGEHGDGTAVESFHRKTDRLVFPSLGKHVKKGQVMIWCGYRQQRIRSQPFVRYQRLYSPALNAARTLFSNLSAQSYGWRWRCPHA